MLPHICGTPLNARQQNLLPGGYTDNTFFITGT